MRRLVFIAVCLLIPPQILAAQVQTPDQALNEFRTQIVGNKFLVRGFSDDSITTFQWDSTGLSFADPKLHTLGVLKPESVQLRDKIIQITGQRKTLVRDKDGSLRLAGDSSAIILVDLQSADPAQVIPELKSALFFSTMQEGLSSVPAGRVLLSADPAQKKSSDLLHSPADKNCPGDGQIYQHATLQHVADAEFSEEAKRAHFSGTVEVVATVDKDGIPRDIWIIRSPGLGLDQKAGEAVAKYKFHPATCDGKPVKTTGHIDVNFVLIS
jgi:TonB family protein